MTWLYKGEPYVEDGEYYGFVYLIENNLTGKKYIGRKYFTQAGYKQIKGKRKKIRKSSGWESYWGSNKVLQEEVKQVGEENYTRTILHLCKTRSACSYWETFEIFSRHALLNELYYNDWCSCKVRRAHLKSCAVAA